MATFEDFLNERNITLKRRYTEVHPAQTVGGSARVRNAIIEALKDGKITVAEFNEIVSQHSSAPSKWTRGNKRFFKIEEDGVSLSKYGTKILNSLVTESVNEKMSNAELKKIAKTKEYAEISQAIRAGQGEYEDMYDMIDPKMFKGLDLKKFEEILDDWFNDEGMVYDSYADFARNAYSHHVAEITKLLMPYNESVSVDEGLNKSDVAYQLAIDYTGRTKPKITKLNKKRIQIKYGYKISPEKVIDSIKTVHPEVELKHVEWSNSMSGGGFHIFDILESKVNEARVSAKKLLKSVAKGESNAVEGIKLSKEMAQSFLDWLDQSSYGRKFSELPFDKLFSAAFNWGIERYAKDSKLKNELKDLKTKAKAMKESTIYTDFGQFINESLNEKSIKDWFTANIDSFKDEKEYMKAGKKAGFSKKELETAMDDFEQGGEDYLESNMYTDFNEFVTEGKERWVVYDTKTKKRLPNAGKVYKDYKAAEAFADKQENAAVASEIFYYDRIKESNEVNEAKPKINIGRYQREGKLGYNDQFHGRHSLSFTLGVDLGLDPKHEFSGGDWPGFDGADLYINGGKKEGTVLADALSGEHTYDDLKSALAKFLGIKESADGFEQGGEDYLETFKLNETFTSKLTGIARRAKDVKDFIKMVFKHEKFKAFDTPKTQPDAYNKFLNFIKSHYEMVQQYESNNIGEKTIYTKFSEFVNEALEINEAFKVGDYIKHTQKSPSRTVFAKIVKANRKSASIVILGTGAAEDKQPQTRMETWQGGKDVDFGKHSKKELDAIAKKLSPGDGYKYSDMEAWNVQESADPINEALKSSKLRGLLTMKRGTKQILKAIYGFSKIALDKITDDQIIDIDPSRGKKAEGLVVYYTTQEKDNPYADTSKSKYNATGKIPANTILAIGMGKDVAYIKRDYINRKMTMSLTTDPRKSSNDIGINKEYRGWDASGIYNVKRVIDVADAAFVINTAALPSAKGKIEDRIKAKEGAVSFKSDKEFKDANMARYREILQKRASELPIDKLVMDAIDDATGVMKDGLKNQEKNKYGELIAGVGADGRAYKLNDISNFINGLISDYERWSGYMAEVEAAEKQYGKDSKEYEWQARYAEKESKEYAKSIKDKLAKLKKRNLAW